MSQYTSHNPMLLISLLSALSPNPVYVRVRRNEYHLRHVEAETQTTFHADVPFSTERMLIGNFSAADRALKAALKHAERDRWLRMPSQILIHPLEMIEGGLSQIEERVLREVAKGVGASKVCVWVGPELSDAEVKNKLRGK